MAKDNKYEKLGLKALDKGSELYRRGNKVLAKKEFDKILKNKSLGKSVTKMWYQIIEEKICYLSLNDI